MPELLSDKFDPANNVHITEEILLVDDDPRCCNSIQLLLSSVGLKSFAAHSVAEAKQALAEKNYCLVLLDLSMPGGEGTELLEHINSNNIDLSVIVVSGETDIQKAVEVFRLGARDFIRKPYNPEELLLTVKNTLKNRSLEIQNRQLADELKSSAKQRDQLQKIDSVGRLAGGIAHDFNNMLTAIMGYAELAISQLDAASPEKEYVLKIQDAAQRSAALTNQLLGFARKQPSRPQVLLLNQAISEALHLLKRLIGEDIELLWQPATDKLKAMIDPSQLIQILTNLIVNARDAIATTGRIEISTDCIYLDEYYWDHQKCSPGNYVVLKVEDDGCGMNEDILEHIFEPFYSAKEEGKGTGLGMATVYDIAKQNHGAIDIISSPGKGTRVQIYLPATEEIPFALEVVPATPGVVRGETILIVEDDIMLLDLWQTVLREAGYRVIASAHPKEALNLVRGRHIDLLLTDVIMPKLNGRELASRLLATRPLLKVIYISGYGSSIAASRGLLKDDVVLLEKPVTHDLLLSKISEVLEEQKTSYPGGGISSAME